MADVNPAAEVVEGTGTVEADGEETLKAMRAEFEGLCKQDKFDYTAARNIAISQGLGKSKLRSLLWRIFLGCMPREDISRWPEAVTKKREEYTALHKQYVIDPHETEVKDPKINNPLSTNENNPWVKFFHNVELEKEIRLDVERIHPDIDFFAQKHIREIMLRILFIYARLHPDLAYKQGMHELLAPFIMMLDKDKIKAPTGTNDLLYLLHDEQFIEHDAFTMFVQVMEVMAQYFKYEKPNNSPTNERTPKKSAMLGDELFGPPKKSDEAITSPVVRKCKHIQYILLKEKDPQLSLYMEDLKIEPQIYALRWTRLLFGREFHLEDVFIVWDAIFAHDNEFQLIDYIGVSMLMYIRGQILQQDQTTAMRRLLKYPPVEDVHLFVEKGIAMLTAPPPASPKKPTTQEPPRTSVASNPLMAGGPAPANGSGGKKEGKTDSGSKGILKPFTSTIKQMMTSDEPNAKQRVVQLQEEVKQLREVQTHMANRLERIVYTFQQEIVATGDLPPQHLDSVLLAVAELKQVKDILRGNLPMTPNTPYLSLLPNEIPESTDAAQPAAPTQQAADPLGALVK